MNGTEDKKKPKKGEGNRKDGTKKREIKEEWQGRAFKNIYQRHAQNRWFGSYATGKPGTRVIKGLSFLMYLNLSNIPKIREGGSI